MVYPFQTSPAQIDQFQGEVTNFKSTEPEGTKSVQIVTLFHSQRSSECPLLTCLGLK